VDALHAQEYQPVEILILDGANVEEARRRAITDSRGEILAFADADMVVDRHWISSIVRAFLADPEVMGVVGPVMARELDRRAQRPFDDLGVGRGFRRRWYRSHLDVAQARGNVAFWRNAFESGQRLHSFVYEPSAIAWRQSLPFRELQRELSQAFADRPLALPSTVAANVSEATRHIDLAEPVRLIADATDYRRLRVDVAWDGLCVGQVVIEHQGAVVSAAWLTDVIAQRLTAELLDLHVGLGDHVLWSTVTATFGRALMPIIEAPRRDRRRTLSAAA